MDAIISVDTSEIDGLTDNNSTRLRTDSLTKSLPMEDVSDIRSVDIMEPVVKTNFLASGEFDVQRVYAAFVGALRQPHNPESPIGTQEYINGWRELLKFVDQLGYIFKFVKEDVVQKLTILQDYVDCNNKNAPNFDTVQNAIDYETQHNLIRKNPETNFTRTLLRLHRALVFIEELLCGLIDRPATDSTVTVATQAYDSTLYHHHGFFVRTTVRVGFRALPSRKHLDEVIFRGQKSELLDQYHTFIKTLKQIYDTVEHLYKEKQYLQLP